MASLQNQTINAIQSVAFLLEEMEDMQISTTVKDTINTQISELSTNMKMLIEDAKEKITKHIKASKDQLRKIVTPPTTTLTLPTQPSQTTITYASAVTTSEYIQL